ncbi:MAG: TonB C-terminal domain-containing protein [Proteobacteria bacterium]|nr:TonB C-terminal domain-containing protein [Pseudomonadota bacterium]MCP4918454.1 TonB C-terminal domain-containing protein [Pseudomonadota bacterium]
MILAWLALASAEMPDDAFEEATPELVEAQKAWLDYTTAASSKVWDVLLADLRGVELKNDQTYALSAAMVVDPTGKLIEVRLDPPSGNADLDARFIKAFKAVGEFGVPPAAYMQSTGEGVFRIGFTLDQRLPPEAVVRIPPKDEP